MTMNAIKPRKKSYRIHEIVMVTASILEDSRRNVLHRRTINYDHKQRHKPRNKSYRIQKYMVVKTEWPMGLLVQ